MGCGFRLRLNQSVPEGCDARVAEQLARGADASAAVGSSAWLARAVRGARTRVVILNAVVGGLAACITVVDSNWNSMQPEPIRHYHVCYDLPRPTGCAKIMRPATVWRTRVTVTVIVLSM